MPHSSISCYFFGADLRQGESFAWMGSGHTGRISDISFAAFDRGGEEIAPAY